MYGDVLDYGGSLLLDVSKRARMSDSSFAITDGSRRISTRCGLGDLIARRRVAAWACRRWVFARPFLCDRGGVVFLLWRIVGLPSLMERRDWESRVCRCIS